MLVEANLMLLSSANVTIVLYYHLFAQHKRCMSAALQLDCNLHSLDNDAVC